MPLRSLPWEIRCMPRFPEDRPRFFPQHEEEFAQARNLQVANALDPNWLQKSNFSVPPPYDAMGALEIDDDDDVITLPETACDDLDADTDVGCDSSSTPSPSQQHHR